MDIHWGFNNIRIKEGDEWKAAFTTKFGLFKPTVMFFSLCNSPASFQHMINARFKIVLDSGFVFICMDDILVVGRTLKELHHWTHEVLKLLKKYSLSCKPVKCQFEKESIKYLSNILSQGKIAVNLKKTASVQAWPTPSCLKDVESFLGTMNFWRHFIFNYSSIAKPFNNLCKKDTPFVWSPSCQTSFDQLKQALVSAPVLRIPDHDCPYCLETDASGFALSGILTQEFDGHWHPVAFYSHSLTPAEQNYPMPDQELLAIVDSLDEWHEHLEGSPHVIEIHTDSQALKSFMTSKQLSCCQAHWSKYLARYWFIIRHVPGKSNCADGFSRRPDYYPSDGLLELQKSLLSPQHFINKIISLSDLDFLDKLKFLPPLPQ